MCFVSEDALSEAEKGEPAPSAGVLGLGKLIPSWSASKEEAFIKGRARAVGKDSNCPLNRKALGSWC